MDYEKAYKASLKTAAQWIKDGCTDKEKICLECVFPGLRESEDERIKNKSGYYKAGKFWKASTLWNAVKGKSPQRVPNMYILQECTWNISSLQRFADEVKNVQEVDLNYPIILDMNGNILDGAHRVVKAYLEGKDIDIVHLGDDEWPEPDYDEEKAVKESEDERIRKAIVKSIEEDSSVYEQEVSKEQMLAYLEKQKENPKSAVSFTDNIIEVRSFQRGMEEGRRLEKQKEQNKCPEFCSGHCVGCERNEQKPMKWSEEDEAMIKSILFVLESYVSKAECEQSPALTATYPTYYKEIDWLKSLRPSWKPSEEQMEALEYVCRVYSSGGAEKSLYNNLKKLCEQLQELV